MQAAYQALAQLILIEVFLKPQGLTGETEQAVLFGSSFLGMVLSLFYGNYISRFRLKKTQLVNIPTIFAGSFLLIASIAQDTWIFVGFCSLSFLCFPLRIPYMTEIYRDNYPSSKRGTYHSWALISAQISTVLVTYSGGYLLKNSPEYWRAILVVQSIALFSTCFLVAKLPSLRVKPRKNKNFWGSLTVLREDRLFVYLIFVWFIFGFANLWIFPLRVTYLSSHLNFDPFTVSILASVIPETTRFVFLPMWAYLFDRINFFALRMWLNLFLLLGMWFYFHNADFWGIALGAFLHGVGFSGGRLAWGLWVTKMAPKTKTNDYMAVNVAATGVRGVFGPFLGFFVLNQFENSGNQYETVSEISCALVLLSIILIVPVLKYGKRE